MQDYTQAPITLTGEWWWGSSAMPHSSREVAVSRPHRVRLFLIFHFRCHWLQTAFNVKELYLLHRAAYCDLQIFFAGVLPGVCAVSHSCTMSHFTEPDWTSFWDKGIMKRHMAGDMWPKRGKTNWETLWYNNGKGNDLQQFFSDILSVGQEQIQRSNITNALS